MATKKTTKSDEKKYDELKKLYQKKPQIQIPEKQLQSEPHNDIIRGA